jgi:AAA+ ATPase superfamily predicted ATPase
LKLRSLSVAAAVGFVNREQGLVELRLLERVVPVTEDPRSTRRRTYRVADNFLAFWLGTVDRYRGEIERRLGPTILPVIRAGLDDNMGPVWEEAFRVHLRRLAAAGELGPDVVAVGRWWREDGGRELDAVVLSGRSRTPSLVGEAKWASSVDARRLEAVLRRRAARLGDVPGELRLAVCAGGRYGTPQRTR